MYKVHSTRKGGKLKDAQLSELYKRLETAGVPNARKHVKALAKEGVLGKKASESEDGYKYDWFFNSFPNSVRKKGYPNELDLAYLVKGKPVYHLDETGQFKDWKGKSEKLKTTTGLANEGIYRVTDSAGKTTIIKVLSSAMPDLNPSALVNTVNGFNMVSKEGGPALLDYGVVTNAKGDRRVYLQMEDAFPGREVDVLKNKDGTLLVSLEASGKKVLHQVGEKFAEAYDHGYIPLDPDFIFSDDGRVRWIDGEWGLQSMYAYRANERFGHAFWTMLATTYRKLGSEPSKRDESMKSMLAGFFKKLEERPGYLNEPIITEIRYGESFQSLTTARYDFRSWEKDAIYKILGDYMDHNPPRDYRRPMWSCPGLNIPGLDRYPGM